MAIYVLLALAMPPSVGAASVPTGTEGPTSDSRYRAPVYAYQHGAKLHRQTRDTGQPAHLAIATKEFREMAVLFWLEKTEAVLQH